MKTFKKTTQKKQEEMRTPVADRLIVPELVEHIRLALYCNPQTNPRPFALELNIQHSKATGGWPKDTVDLRNYPTDLKNIRYKMPSQWRETSHDWYQTAFDLADDFEKSQSLAFPTLHAKMGARLGEAGNQRYYNIAGVVASVHCSTQPQVLLQIAHYDDSKEKFVAGIASEFTLAQKRQFKVAHNIYWDDFDAN